MKCYCGSFATCDCGSCVECCECDFARNPCGCPTTCPECGHNLSKRNPGGVSQGYASALNWGGPLFRNPGGVSQGYASALNWGGPLFRNPPKTEECWHCDGYGLIADDVCPACDGSGHVKRYTQW